MKKTGTLFLCMLLACCGMAQQEKQKDIPGMVNDARTLRAGKSDL